MQYNSRLKTRLIAIAAALLLAVLGATTPASGQADSIHYKVSLSWSEPFPQCNEPVACSGTGTRQFSTGSTDSPTDQPTTFLLTDPVSVTQEPGGSADIGRLQYCNGTTLSGSTVTSLTLRADFQVDGHGAASTEQLTFLITTLNTLDEVASADFIHFGSEPATQFKVLEGQCATIQLVGRIDVSDSLSVHFGPVLTPSAGFVQMGLPTVGQDFCEGKSDDGWIFRSSITPSEGLEVTDVRYGPRYVARRIIINQIFILQGSQSWFGKLTPTTDSSQQISSTLVDTKCRQDGSIVAVQATYRLKPVGANFSILLEQFFRFDPYDPNADSKIRQCEPTESVPCVRFWPTVTWAYEGPGFAPAIPVELNMVEKFEFDPDRGSSGASELISDAFRSGTSIRTLGGGHIPKEGTQQTIRDGHAVFHSSNIFNADWAWDNWHQTDRSSVGLPGLGSPGCSECVHAHWRWDSFVNESWITGAAEKWTDGNPEILDHSHQNGEIFWVKYADGTPGPTGLPVFPDVVDYLNNRRVDHKVKNQRLALYWHGSSRVGQGVETPVVEMLGSHYNGDAFWPQLNDTKHGGNGSMFLVPARRLDTDRTEFKPWLITPEYDKVSQNPDGSYSLLVTVHRPGDPIFGCDYTPGCSIRGGNGPFYVVVKSAGFDSNAPELLNPDDVWSRTPFGSKYVTLGRQRIDPGVTVTSELRFSGRPDKNSGLSFSLVAAPDGTESYEPVAGLDFPRN